MIYVSIATLAAFLITIVIVMVLYPKCEHVWRPALYKGRIARKCQRCPKVENLTEEEFYAQFGGRMLRDWQPRKKVSV